MPRTGVMLAVKFTEKRLRQWLQEDGEVIIQPKLNGLRMRWDGYTLWTSGGKLYRAAPHISRELYSKFPDIPLDGECYIHNVTLEYIQSLGRRTKNLHEKYRELKFHVFDMSMNGVQKERLTNLYWLFEGVSTDYIERVESFTVRTCNDVIANARWFVNEGYEGAIVRKVTNLYVPRRTVEMMKMKKAYRDTFVIVGYFMGDGKYYGTLGALEVMNDNGQKFHVGSFAITDDERAHLWSQRDSLIGAKARIRYVQMSAGGVPPSSVFECIV